MEKNNPLTLAIIKTFCYFAVFKYPLTLRQISKYMHGFKVSQIQIKRELGKTNAVHSSGGYYFFPDKQKDVTLRIKHKKISKKLLNEAKKMGKILSFIPTIKLIGVSGSLSMNNCKEGDDIDLFIVTGNNSLWLSRILVVGLIFFLGKKRSRFGASKGKVCTNMWMSKGSLEATKKNIYVAHELAQLKVLVDKNNAYQNLLGFNQWIYRYLPNIYKFEIPREKRQDNRLFERLLYPIETICFYMQITYMKRKSAKGKETVNRNLAMFHPNDYTKSVLGKYKKEMASRMKNTNRHESDVVTTRAITSNFSLNLITPGS